jgi:cystathionine beta-lyase
MAIDELDIEQLRLRAGEKWTHYPSDILPSWVADMDFEIALPIRTALERRIASSDCGYPVPATETGLPEIFTARVQQRFGWDISPGSIDLFNDVVQAIHFGLLALASDGDGVVIQTPIYPPFIEATEVTQRRPVLCPLVTGRSGYEIDFDQMQNSIDASTRILLLCNPHNPTGRCFTRQELEGLAELALANDLSIISDEIHADLVFSPHSHIPIASLSPEVAERTVTVMSASKAFNIAGICLAFAVFGGEAIRKKFDKIPRHLRGGVSALSVAAVSAAMTQAQPWLDEVVGYLHANRDYLSEHARDRWPRVGYYAPDATYLSWFDFRSYDLRPNPYAFFLEQAKVALGNGARFGEPGRGFVRLNFATSRNILEQITERMDLALDHVAALEP